MDKKQFSKCPARYYSEKAFTLVEIMIVLVILGILMAWLGSKVIGAGDKAKAQLTRSKLVEIATAIEQYQLQYNALPQSTDDLIGCTSNTGNSCVPILKKESIEDGWGTKFIYSLEDGGRRYKITSLGADKKEGGEAVNADLFGTGP